MARSESGSSAGHAWSLVARSLLRESQEDSDETQKCEACRSETGSVIPTTEDSASSPKISSSSWWAELVKIHYKKCRPDASGHGSFQEKRL